MTKKRKVVSSVKDEQLVEVRRQQMIKAAVKLFKEKGFHRTTTREIAKASGFSIGTLYEYIRAKEDILFLLCDGIYEELQSRLSTFVVEESTVKELKIAIHQYYELIHTMSDEYVVMYQESKSLTKDALQYVLQKELEMVGLFESILTSCVQLGELRITKKEIPLAAHHIVIQGQMWAFRRWALAKHYSIDEFINMQIDHLLKGIEGK